MDGIVADCDDAGDVRQKERARLSEQRRETYEAHRLLENFANPEDLYDEVSAEDAHHDEQMALYRGLAHRYYSTSR